LAGEIPVVMNLVENIRNLLFPLKHRKVLKITISTTTTKSCVKLFLKSTDWKCSGLEIATFEVQYPQDTSSLYQR